MTDIFSIIDCLPFFFTSFQLFSVHPNLQFHMKSNFYVWKCGFSKKFSSTRWFPPNWNSTLKGLISCELLLDGHTPCSRNIFIKRGSVLQVFLIPFVVNSKGEKRNLNTKLLDSYLLLSTSALLTHFYSRFEFNSSLWIFQNRQLVPSLWHLFQWKHGGLGPNSRDLFAMTKSKEIHLFSDNAKLFGILLLMLLAWDFVFQLVWQTVYWTEFLLCWVKCWKLWPSNNFMLLISFHAFFVVCWRISVFDSLKFRSHILGNHN